MGATESERGELQIYQGSTFANRLVRGLQHLNHAQARFSIIDWRLVFGNALDEIRQFVSKCLGTLQSWRPHVPRAVVDEQVVNAFSAANGYTSVVYFDLFVCSL